MLTLAIDCSARFCSSALYRAGEDRVLAAASPDIGRGHAEHLPSIVQSVLVEAKIELQQVDRIGVTVGPGSFAGIRVGVAFARGLALALDVPVIGVGALEAIAVPAARQAGNAVMAVLDARRDRVWAIVVAADGAVVRAGAELTPQAAAALALETGCAIIGSGASQLAAVDLSLQARILDRPVAPRIEDVACLAARLDPDRNPAEPRYLREADAKPQTGFAVPHKAVV